MNVKGNILLVFEILSFMIISLDIFHFVKNSGTTILCLKRNVMILENPLFHNDDLWN